MGLFNSIFDSARQNSKIKVHFIDYTTNERLEVEEIGQEYLPTVIGNGMSVFIDGIEWLIINAEPSHALQYSFTKKLQLWITNADSLKYNKADEHPAEGRIIFGHNKPNTTS